VENALHITAKDKMLRTLRFMISSDREFCGPDHAMSSKFADRSERNFPHVGSVVIEVEVCPC
jgi:hypothetical protein